MSIHRSKARYFLIAAVVFGGCGQPDGSVAEDAGSGGEPGSGGKAGAGEGGASGSSGGATGSGGLSGAGGGSGGSKGTGGMSGAAGHGAGGNGTGGAMGSGGAPASGGRTGSGGTTGSGGATGAGGSGNGRTISTQGITCSPQTWDAEPIGWATASGGTTGGGAATPTVVTSMSQLNTAAGGTRAAVIHVSGRLSGTASIGSNKTIWGLCGAEIDGSLDLSGSSNVIVRNLKVVGPNGSSSTDSVHVQGGDRHLWFDHMDISDGDDGNLDITHGCDFITVSWTKFHYSGTRAHQFCNLIGHDDANGSEDSGHLNVTFHHVWWADHVDQRMPRVRFGKVHVFNNLYTASGDTACIEVGVSCNIRSEQNVFQGIRNPVDASHANSASVIQSTGNVGPSGVNTNRGGSAFTPPYAYTLESTSSLAATVMSGAGPK